MKLLDLKEETKEKTYILSYLPKNLSDLIGNNKKIHYNGRMLKKAYLIDIIHTLIKKSYYIQSVSFNLSSEILRIKYGTHYNYLMNYLLDNNIIKMVSNYYVGKKTKTYILLPKTLKCVVTVENSDTFLIKKYNDFRKVESLRKLNNKFISVELMVKIIDNLDRVTINYTEADEYINTIKLNKNQYTKNTHDIKCLKHRDIWFTFDKYGRFHSNLTTLKSGIRDNFLLIDGEVIKEIDIANSQPIFLTQIMSDNLDKVDIEEYEFFKQLVINGKLYEYVSINSGGTRIKKVKTSMYKVFFGKNHLASNDNVIFNQLFPSIFKFIKGYKKEKDNHKVLSHELQGSESNLLFNNIIRNVVDKYPELPFFTVHDSISIKYSDYDKVKEIFDYNINKLYKNL